LAKALASGTLNKGIAVCGSGVGACIAANKVKGVRAALINDYFSAHQGVEDDDMNLICLGGRVISEENALKVIAVFLQASFSGEVRHQRRVDKVKALENK
jgi:ribose 5-phosphate isomerase B